MIRRNESAERENHCFGCGDSPWGLRLQFQFKDGWAVTETSVHSNFQGFEGAVHGGIVATLMDEAFVWATAFKTGSTGPTYEIFARLRERVPTGEKILVRARVLECRHKICSGEMEVLDSQGHLLTRGRGRLKILEEAEPWMQ